MLFSEPVFVFLFLPLLFLVYVVVPRAARNAVLLLASLLFYAWGEKFFVLVMLGSIAFNYLIGLLIEAGRRPACTSSFSFLAWWEIWACWSPSSTPASSWRVSIRCSWD